MNGQHAAPQAAPQAAPRASRRSWSWTVHGTPIGPLLLAATGLGLVSVVFHADERVTSRALARLSAALGSAPVGEEGGEAGRVLAGAAAELDAYFRGELRGFSTPLDWSLASDFTERALRTLADSVPYGSVVGYQELAEAVGDPGAARAVGAAMGANPLPVIVPCHRVVAADGGIGGFGGGLAVKRSLLALEGVLPAPLF